MVTALPQVRSGKLRALGVLGAKRFDLLPDVQTVAETVPGYDASTWAGIGVPRATPPEIIERLNREVNAGLAQPDMVGLIVGELPGQNTASTAGIDVLFFARRVRSERRRT